MATLFFSEDLVSSLEAFSTQQEKTVTAELLKIVENISKTGVVCFSWNTLKPLLSHLLNQALKTYIAKIADRETSDDDENNVEKRSQRFLYALESFEEAPFTVQRLCELILSPEKVYSTYYKYISALEKMVNITSTVPTLTPQQIQTINQTGVIAPLPDDDVSNATSSITTQFGEEFPTSMNVDVNGVQAIFPHQQQQQQQQQIQQQIQQQPPVSESEDKALTSVNLQASQEEKPPTPMDM